jgi:hypothetical protein
MASAWLCGQLGVDAGGALAVGNDFNDIELLEWAPARRVVANAPAALRDRYQTVVSNDADGFSEAVDEWLRGC